MSHYLFKCSLNRPHAEVLEVLAPSTYAAALDFADAELLDLTDDGLDVRVRWPAAEHQPEEVWRVERFEGKVLARLVSQKTRLSFQFVSLN